MKVMTITHDAGGIRITAMDGSTTHIFGNTVSLAEAHARSMSRNDELEASVIAMRIELADFRRRYDKLATENLPPTVDVLFKDMLSYFGRNLEEA